MKRENSTQEEPKTPVASEPAAEYKTATREHLRVVSDEELARCMTLEESRRLITEKIYRFYHGTKDDYCQRRRP